MKKLGAIILVSILLTACGGAGSSGGTGNSADPSASKLDFKVAGKDSTLNVKTGAIYLGNVISTAPGKPNIQTFAHTIYLANYEMETTSPGWTRKVPSAPDQMRIDIQLTGEEGTKTESPFKVGTYSAKADKFNSVRFAQVITFADGKQAKTFFDTLPSDSKVDGEVKITEVTADSVTGEVNLIDGGNSIKGTFTAKLPKAK
ncbi:MAG TPA: hypothetical protein VJV21_02170 [Pyrinomonadaceae bacterium]|nr:hypothetical protein [Pyrinomonadaceae bacterium]